MVFGIFLLFVFTIGVIYKISIFIFPLKEGFDSIDRVYYRDKSLNESRALENKDRMMLAFTNPESREKQIYHGGCIRCITPEIKGIGNCRSCQYFAANWNMKDRSKTQS